MSASLGPGMTLQFFISDTVNNVPLTSVPADDIFVATSGDTNDFTVAMDAAPVQDPALGAPPTVASGTITSSATPDQPNVPVNLTLGASGDATLSAASLTDTITVN